MRWTPQQESALRAVSEWFRGGESQVFRVFGYAGTGKTTLARHFAEGIDGDVMYLAYTGKAAHVMHLAGCAGAQTIHSAIYHARDKSKRNLMEYEDALMRLRAELRDEGMEETRVEQHRRVRELRAKVEEERDALARPNFSLNLDSPVRQASLLVVDEVSMVGGQMGQDLCSFGVPILVLGDPAQLPPVGDGGFFTEGVEPDVMLTDIHRQARDNPIIRLASMAREERPIPLGQYGESVVTEEVSPEDALEVDQILAGRNKTRRASNWRVRALRGFDEPLPLSGDRLVCLRNNHDLGLLNGSVWMCTDVCDRGDERVVLTVSPEEGGIEQTVEAHTHYFLGKEENLPWWDRKEAEEFDYGYCLTVHKAQGSQFGNTLLFDESWCFREHRWRWLYTAITRAAERIKIVRR